MKTKSKKFANKTTREPVYDLFGEIIVTLHDIFMWVCVVTRGRYLGRQRRYDWYVKNWDIAGKVRCFKQYGRFCEIEAEYNEKFHEPAWNPVRQTNF